MFSGIVEEAGQVTAITPGSQSMRLSIQSRLDLRDTQPGHSIAVDGVCLTVTAVEGQRLHFDAGSETVRRSSLAALRVGDRVNIERAALLGARMHGHLVTGHVDGTVALLSRTVEGITEKFVWELPAELRAMVVPKGSVALAGISLTVGEVTHHSFSVYLIPHTVSLTTLPQCRPADRVNIEVDILARYVQGVLGHGRAEAGQDLVALLEKSGFISGTSR